MAAINNLCAVLVSQIHTTWLRGWIILQPSASGAITHAVTSLRLFFVSSSFFLTYWSVMLIVTLHRSWKAAAYFHYKRLGRKVILRRSTVWASGYCMFLKCRGAGTSQDGHYTKTSMSKVTLTPVALPYGASENLNDRLKWKLIAAQCMSRHFMTILRQCGNWGKIPTATVCSSILLISDRHCF